jgi:hypothetical protein
VGRLGRLLGRLGRPVGPSWGPLGGFLGRLGVVLEASRDVMERRKAEKARTPKSSTDFFQNIYDLACWKCSWRALQPSWGYFGRLGAIFQRLGAFLNRLGCVLGPSWVVGGPLIPPGLGGGQIPSFGAPGGWVRKNFWRGISRAQRPTRGRRICESLGSALTRPRPPLNR